MSLQIDVVPFNIPAVSIPYQQFHVGDAASGYLLTVTSDTPGDRTLYTSLNHHSESRFYTSDRDNSGVVPCARMQRTSWWFSDDCGPMNLNGVYLSGTSDATYKMRMSYLSDNPLEPIRTENESN